MSVVIKGLLAVCWLMIVPTAAGFLIMKKQKNVGIGECFAIGGMLLFSVMEVITLPLIVMKAPLHILTVLYGSIAVILALAGAFCFQKQKALHSPFKIEGKISIYFWIALVIIVMQIAMCVLMAHMDADDSYYVATATTDIYTDTICEINPYNGREYMKLPSRYVLSPFPVFLAVVSQLSAGLHPAIMAHMVYPAVFLIFAYVVQSFIGKYFYPEDRTARDIYLLIIVCICSFSAYSVYNAGCFQMVRIWQGKAVLASVMIPMLIYLCLTIILEEKPKYSWFFLGLADMSCCFLSSMGIMLAPLVIGAFLLVNLFFRRDFKCLLKGILCCLPSAVLGLVYLHAL